MTAEENLNQIIALLEQMDKSTVNWKTKMAEIKTLIDCLPERLTNHSYTSLSAGGRGNVYQTEWRIFGPQAYDFDNARCSALKVSGICKSSFYESKGGKRTLPDAYIGDGNDYSPSRFDDARQFLNHLKIVNRQHERKAFLEVFKASSNDEKLSKKIPSLPSSVWTNIYSYFHPITDMGRVESFLALQDGTNSDCRSDDGLGAASN